MKILTNTVCSCCRTKGAFLLIEYKLVKNDNQKEITEYAIYACQKCESRLCLEAYSDYNYNFKYENIKFYPNVEAQDVSSNSYN